MDDVANLSDHLPIVINLSLPPRISGNNCLTVNNMVHKFRWDKGDCTGFYFKTGSMLGNSIHNWPCFKQDGNCIADGCHTDILL